MTLQDTLQTSTLGVLQHHLSDSLAKRVAGEIADATSKAVADAITSLFKGKNGHNGNGNGHAKHAAAPVPAKRRPGRPRKAVAAAPTEGAASLSSPSQEVMRLKKKLFWAKDRSNKGKPSIEGDAELLAAAEEIEKLTTQEFQSKGLTAESYMKKLLAKSRRAQRESVSNDLPV